ncbi:MAG: MlaD family protein, partial [bacterium]|nr:MlaD family protein [bacterium]
VYLLLFFVSVRFYEYFKTLKRDNFYTLVANIKHTDELKKGAFVRLSGVDVGTVSNLELLPNFSVKVFMQIDNGISIPDDSSVAIYTDGLIGAKYIAILPGGSMDYMQNGDEFEFAQDSVNITEMIEIGIEQFKSKEK